MDDTEAPPGPLIGGFLQAVSDDLRERLRPARWVVHEWTDYWLQHPEAAAIRINGAIIEATPPQSGNFRIRFENQLGLTSIEVFDVDQCVLDCHHLEVIAPKLGTPEASLNFLEATLAALYQQIATVPFVLGTPTGRQVRDERSTRHPLFDFHFFRQHGPAIQAAVQAILAQPHRRLSTEEWLVLPHQVRQVDRTAMLHVLQTARPLAGVAATASPLQRLRPERVLQQIPTETWDTPENRFVRDVAQAMLLAMEVIRSQRWWSDLDGQARAPVRETTEFLRMLVTDHRFAGLGPLTVSPMQSRVLQRKDGYRELTALWPRFQRAQEPLFAAIESAIALRQIDKLYELWVLFDLIEQIGQMTGEVARITPKVDQFGAPTNSYAATFGDQGTPHYNRTKRTYSGLPLRPDYLWVPTDGSQSVALDAKFRLRSEFLKVFDDEGVEKWESTGEAKATTDDLTKMHAYRDAYPNVRAAVVIYPDTRSFFRHLDHTQIQEITVARILHDETLEGIGAVARVPIGTHWIDGRDDE